MYQAHTQPITWIDSRRPTFSLVRRCAEAALAERDRWMLWTPVLLGLGIALYFALPAEPAPWTGALALAGVVAATAAIGRLWRSQRRPVVLAGIAVGMIVAGFTAAQVRTLAVAAPVLSQRVGPIAVTGRVAAVDTFADGIRVTLAETTAARGRERLPPRVRIRLRGDQPPIGPGDRIRVSAMLSPPSPPAVPGAFDFQRQAWFQGLGAVGFSVGSATVIEAAPAADGVLEWFARLRVAIAGEVRRNVADPAGAVILALLVGEQRAIPEPTMVVLRDSGLVHLLSISGMHIGLVAALLMVSIRSALALIPPIALRYPIKKWAAAASVLGAGFYMLLAGAPVPAQRSFLMVAIILFAILVDRRTTPMRLIAAAGLVICIAQPEAILGPSFQMSFAAVVALIAAYEVLSASLRRGAGETRWWRRPALYVAGIALSSIVATAATAPFVLYHFNRLALYGLAANMIAVPLTSIWIMPWAVVSMLLMPFGLANLGLQPMALGVDAVIWVARTVASWPGAVGSVAPMPVWSLAACTLGGLWLCLWRGSWRWWGTAVIAAGILGMSVNRPPDVLIDGEAKLIAVRTDDGDLALSSATRAPMVRETWLRFNGGPAGAAAKPALFPWFSVSDDGSLRCDGAGCVLTRAGQQVALALDEEALLEDCRRADIIVSAVPIRTVCPRPHLVIDRFAVWRHGGHAVWIGGAAPRIETVNGRRGERPWVPRPGGSRREPDESDGD